MPARTDTSRCTFPGCERELRAKGLCNSHYERQRLGHAGDIKAPRDPVWIRWCRNVAKTEGCWLWTGAKNGNGYGRLNVAGVAVLAHRLAFYFATGIDPGELGVLHRCDTPACVNPEHLFLGDQAVNMTDAMLKGRLKRTA